MIYFMQPVQGGPVKIGHSIDVDTRRSQLEARYGQPLAILATMPGDRDEEQELHARFSHLRFGRTEQFRPAPDLMGFIGRPLLVDANPDAVEAMPSPESKSIAFRSSAAYTKWVEELAKANRSTVSGLLDQALAAYAEKIGFEKEAPERA